MGGETVEVEEEGDFNAGGPHSQQWQLRHNSTNFGSGVEDSKTDLQSEGDDNGNGVIEPGEEGYEGSSNSQWFDAVANDLSSADYWAQQRNNAYSKYDRDASGYGVAASAARTVAADAAAGNQAAIDLKNNYEATRADVKTALAAESQNHGAANFLALEVAEQKNESARADMIIYEGKKNGDANEVARGNAMKQSSDQIGSDLQKIANGTPAEQTKALQDWVKQHPNSEIAKDYREYNSGDMSDWQHTANADVMNRPQYNSWGYGGYGGYGGQNDYGMCAADDYGIGTGIQTSNDWTLSSVFRNSATGTLTSSPAPTPTVTAPATTVTQQQPVPGTKP